MSNTALFDEFTARILADLYENFPVRIDLDALERAGDATVDDYGVPRNEQGQRSRRFEVCIATISWLADEGYIAAGTRLQHGFLDCVLTSRGLGLLRSAPETLKGKGTLGERLVAAVRAETPSVAVELVRSLLTIGTG